MAKHTKIPLQGFTARLRDAWEESELSQGQVAAVCGVNRKAICAYVNGVSVPDATTLGKMCKLFKVSADWLLFGGRA